MEIIYFTNNGTERRFKAASLEEAVQKWVKRRSHGNANWGHVYVDGNRIWL